MLENKSIASVVSLMVLTQLVVSCQAFKSVGQELCGNGKIKLQSMGDLSGTSTKGCDYDVKKAFVALEKLVAHPNVCTMDKATDIIRFYEDHLRDPDWQASKSRAHSLITKFAVAYGLQAGKACRIVMKDEFFAKARKSLEASDFEAIKEWTRNDSPIARLLGSISKRGEFLLPSDFSALTPEVVGKLKLKMIENSGKVLRAQEVCEKRFRPLYEPIVLPIAYLARNGLNHNRFTYEIPLVLEKWTRENYALWSRIVFVCESLKEIEVVEAPTGSTSQSDHHAVRRSTNDLQIIPPYKPFSLINGMKLAIASSLRRAEKFPLYSMGNLRLSSAMRSYNVTMSETDRFRKRLLSNKWGLLIATFKSNEQTRTLLKKAFGMAVASWQRKRHENQNQELESAKKDLLGLVDAKKNSTIFRVLAKILRGGMEVVWALALLLEIVMVLSVTVFFMATIVVDIIGAGFGFDIYTTGFLIDFINQL